MANSNEDSTPAPIIHPSANSTSEVGSGPVVSMQEHMAIMRELIQLRAQRSSVEPRNLSLPRFNPDTVAADPAAWCSTATLMMKGNPLQGNELFSVLSRALEGSVAHWLTQVLTDEDVTWPIIRELFISRFGGKETTASALMKASRERPLKNESPGVYGNRLRSLLKMRRQHLTNAEIINATTLYTELTRSAL
jgi:hypothetical protein